MKRRKNLLIVVPLLTAFAIIAAVSPVIAQKALSDEDLARANNPLANIRALTLQNYYIPKLYDLPEEVSNTFWLRGAAPVKNWLIRGSLPLNTVPVGGAESLSGLGDFNVFGAYLAVSEPAKTFGVGPLLVAPTASEDALGAGKWQLGAAAVAFAALSPVVHLGGLVTWQTSVGGDNDRSDTSILAIQPFSFWQLGGGTYLRTVPIWVFDLKSGHYNVPFGVGIGKVIKTSRVVYNLYIEPQFTILHDGMGQPAIQVLSGSICSFSQSSEFARPTKPRGRTAV
jgi:hypothetical protein